MLLGFEGTVGSAGSLASALGKRLGRVWDVANEPIRFGTFIDGPQAKTVGRHVETIVHHAPPMPQTMILRPFGRQIGRAAAVAVGSVQSVHHQVSKLGSVASEGSVHDAEYDDAAVQEQLQRLEAHGFINQLVQSYAKRGSARYFKGPSTLGIQAPAIAKAGVAYIAGARAKGEELIIAGYSRGGLIAVNVCNELARLGQMVQLLILFDPVDRALGPEAQNVSAAVRNCILIQREHSMITWVPYTRQIKLGPGSISVPDVALTQSRFWFGKMVNEDDKATLTSGGFEHREFDATHAAFGGVPWTGDFPGYLTQREDRAQAARMAQTLNLEVGRLTNGWCPMLALTMPAIREA